MQKYIGLCFHSFNISEFLVRLDFVHTKMQHFISTIVAN